jgi:S1-C subfamily serine protease
MGPGNRHDEEPLDDHSEGSHDEFGDESDDDHSARRGPLPDPLDRVWLHPTELSRLGGAFAPEDPAHPGGAGSGTTTRRRTVPWLAPLLAGAAGALLTVTALAVTGSFDRSTESTSALPPLDATGGKPPSAADTLTRLGPSVVTILATDAQGKRRGSGVCVKHGAQLLTSMRVVGRATTVEVTTADGRKHTATVIGRDRVTSLVLLDISDDANLPAAQLADTAPATGSSVWLLGAPTPGAKSPWMSSGMTSSTDALAVSDLGPTTSGLLETDAASNTNAVGGALVNTAGSVAGIVLGHVNGSATTYAVSIDVAVGVARELDANGVATHGTLGISGVDTQFGPMIATMATGAPAARAGAHVKDLIQAIDGRSVETIGDVTALVHGQTPGRTVIVKLLRGNETLEMKVRLGATAG